VSARGLHAHGNDNKLLSRGTENVIVNNILLFNFLISEVYKKEPRCQPA
jgi:hypothetical protein